MHDCVCVCVHVCALFVSSGQLGLGPVSAENPLETVEIPRKVLLGLMDSGNYGYLSLHEFVMALCVCVCLPVSVRI